GTCWLRRYESSGKCSQLFARNVTRESCCGAGSNGGKGFSERDIPDVGLFFINAFNDGMECTSCLGRPRQLRYTGPETVDGRGGRSVKKSSLSENRSAGGSQRASAKPSAKDNAKDKKHNLLESVTLVSSSRGGSSSNSSKNSRSSGTSTSKGTHQSRNCTAAGYGPVPPGCTPSGRDWTGGERIVLQQNGLALNLHPTGSKAVASKGGVRGRTAATTYIPPTTRRHHRKDGPVRGNQTMNEQTHRKSTTVAPFVAFGKPKLLRVPRVGRKQNGTAVRVPRREPNYLDDVFFIENYHQQQQRRNRKHQGLPMEDLWGNEIMANFYNPVCGTDGRTYKTECQLKKRACRQEITSLLVAYKGHCQTSCKFVQCPDGKRCIEDQNATPHCVSCGGAECRADRSPKSVVCGTDGITYPNICELKRQACLSGRAIPVAYRGR
uniref:Kazal-like domain-containing protein n=1 Tax=Anopheles minimus TaxID=112268 RepID=A0A182WCF3_9DIPT